MNWNYIPLNIEDSHHIIFVGRAFGPCAEGQWFDPWSGQVKD